MLIPRYGGRSSSAVVDARATSCLSNSALFGELRGQLVQLVGVHAGGFLGGFGVAFGLLAVGFFLETLLQHLGRVGAVGIGDLGAGLAVEVVTNLGFFHHFQITQ